MLIHFRGASLGGAAHGELHGHDRQAQHYQADKIDQNEDGSAVLTGDIGEFPDVADTNGTACRQQDEAKTAAQMFSLHF